MSYESVILDELNYGGLPVGYWPLQVASGIVAPDVIGVNDGTFLPNSGGAWTGGTLDTRPGLLAREGGVATFGGVQGYVSVPNHASLQITGALTIELWMRSAALIAGGSGGLVSKSSDNKYFGMNIDKVYELGILSNTIHFQISDGTDSSSANGSIFSLIDDKPHHVIVRWDGTTDANGMQIWFDAVKKYQTTSTITAIQAPANTLDMGGWRTIWPYKGDMGHVAISAYALADDRIIAHYLAGLNGTPDLKRLVC